MPPIPVRLRLASPHWSAELWLLAASLVITLFVALNGAECQLLLSLYYLPIVISAFYLGRYRSGVLSCFNVLVGGTAFAWSNLQLYGMLHTVDIVAFIIWAATLGLAAVVTGTLSDAWRHTMAKLSESHRKEALTDALTGLMNRRGLDEHVSEQVELAHRHDRPLTLLMVDIDHFKDLNDRHGHNAGDIVLADVANVLRQVTRRDRDEVARYGGEEFAVLLTGTGVEVASELAERIRNSVHSTRFPFNELSLRITVSVGLAQLLPKEDAHSLMRRADAALYCSKEAGRNCVHHHDGSKNRRIGLTGSLNVNDSPATQIKKVSIDDATGMPTVHIYLDELRRRLAECRRYDTELTIAVIGLDSYDIAVKQDLRAAKDLITTIAGLATSILRNSDMTARCGDSTLCLMLPHTSVDSCFVPLDRLRQRASEYRDPRYPELSFSISIGVAQFSPDVDSCERALFERASLAMRAGVDALGNCIFVNDGKDCFKARPAPGIAPIIPPPPSAKTPTNISS